MAWHYRNKQGRSFIWEGFCKCCPGTVTFQITTRIGADSIGDAIPKLSKTTSECDQCGQAYLGSDLLDIDGVWRDAMIRARPEDERRLKKKHGAHKRTGGRNGGRPPGTAEERRRRYTERRAIASEMRRAGASLKAIGKELGISPKTVSHYLRKDRRLPT